MLIVDEPVVTVRPVDVDTSHAAPEPEIVQVPDVILIARVLVLLELKDAELIE